MASSQHLLHWPCSLQRLVETLIDEPLADPAIVEAMKDVRSCEILNGDWENGKRRVELALLLDPPIPLALQNLLKPENLGWTQLGLWDPKTGVYEVKIIPNTLKNLVKISMKSYMRAKGEHASTQDMTLTATCDIPLLGPIFEQFALTKIWESLKNQHEETAPRLLAEAVAGRT